MNEATQVSAVFSGSGNSGVQIGQVFNYSRSSTANISIAGSAIFNSYSDQDEALCLPGTRTAVLEEILQWAEEENGPCIFWLDGMAGTGKSTIARTVARRLAKNELGDSKLGASFFFRRDHQTRSNGALFFTTIAVQLATHRSSLATNIAAAIDADPALANKEMSEQYDKLVYKPCLAEPPSQSRMIIVVDALDECEKSKDAEVLISLLANLNKTPMPFKIFVTSRPQRESQLAIFKIKNDYRHFILHEIPRTAIDADLKIFFKAKLAQICDEYNSVAFALPGVDSLTSDWPTDDVIAALIRLASPLFIFATTLCRFVEDPTVLDPEFQLKSIFNNPNQPGFDQLWSMYSLILEKAVSSNKDITMELKLVLGTVTLLAEPLSIASLAILLDVPRRSIGARLSPLYSVIRIPATESEPLSILHLSFRDFLTNTETVNKTPFGIHEPEMHAKMAKSCLALLKKHLREDICGLGKPGTKRSEIDTSVFTPAFRYATLFWVYHIEKSGTAFDDDHPAAIFLKAELLHWLEVIGILGETPKAINMIRTLLNMSATVPDSSHITLFLQDASSFILTFRHVIDLAPLQLYSSAILLSPQNSLVRKEFESCVPLYMSMWPEIHKNRNACLQTIESHGETVTDFALSKDGGLLVTIAEGGIIHLWKAPYGMVVLTLDHSGAGYVAMSPDGAVIASAGNGIVLWDVATGKQMHRFDETEINSITFSPNGKWLAVLTKAKSTLRVLSRLQYTGDQLVRFGIRSTDEEINLWNVDTGEKQSTSAAFEFGPDCCLVGGERIASLDPAGVKITHIAEAQHGKHDVNEDLRKPGAGLNFPYAITEFVSSPNGRFLAAGTRSGYIHVYDVHSKTMHSAFHGHIFVHRVMFAANGMLLSLSYPNAIKFWNVRAIEQGTAVQKPLDLVVTISESSKSFAKKAGSSIQIWEMDNWTPKNAIKRFDAPPEIYALAFSNNDQMIAAWCEGQMLQVWQVDSGELLHNLHSSILDKASSQDEIEFSPDCSSVAIHQSRKKIVIQDLVSGQVFEVGPEGSRMFGYLPDGNILVAAEDITVTREMPMSLETWDRNHGCLQQVMTEAVSHTMLISADGATLAMKGSSGFNLVDAATGAIQGNIKQENWEEDTKETQKYTDIAFTADHKLQTDRGIVAVRQGPENRYRIVNRSERGLACGEIWLSSGGEDVLWIPVEYRPGLVYIRGDLVIFVELSGEVLAMRCRYRSTDVKTANISSGE